MSKENFLVSAGKDALRSIVKDGTKKIVNGVIGEVVVPWLKKKLTRKKKEEQQTPTEEQQGQEVDKPSML